MTSIAAAVAVDSRGPCALYIITDSRITWGDSENHWDAGRKTFYSQVSPDIFGYCGDAYFAPIILGQIIDILQNNLFEFANMNAIDRHQIVLEIMKSSIDLSKTKYKSNFSIFHGAKQGNLMCSNFLLWHTKYDVNRNKWSDDPLNIAGSSSYFVHIDGSGKSVIINKSKNFERESAKGTSRAAIYSFCQALRSREDDFSGGPPQLVGIWRKGFGRQFGFCWNGKSYIAGLPVPKSANYDSIQWFNHLFEVCDGKTGSKMRKSKSHRASLEPRQKRSM